MPEAVSSNLALVVVMRLNAEFLPTGAHGSRSGTPLGQTNARQGELTVARDSSSEVLDDSSLGLDECTAAPPN